MAITNRLTREECEQRIWQHLCMREDHPIPLFRAGAEGVIDLTICPRGKTPERPVFWGARPSVILVGASTGPSGWPHAGRLASSASAVILHASGGGPEHYGKAVAFALLFNTVLFVETNSACLAAWQATTAYCAPDADLYVITTFPGRSHPISSAPLGATLK